MRTRLFAALTALFLTFVFSGQTVLAAPPQSKADKSATARRAITDDPIAPKWAPKGYDVTIVVYSDYNCPYCKAMHPALDQLMKSDPKVRIVFRDWPIFGPASLEAARLAIASQWQNKHRAFDDALMKVQGKLNSAKIRAAADTAGVDWNQLQIDLKKHRVEIDSLIYRTREQAERMGLTGTPSLLIGPYLLPGATNYDGLKQAVALTRKYPDGDAPSAK